jgi:hypothetical protein
MTKDKEPRPVGRPKGYRKLDALIVCDLTVGLDADTAKWLKSLPTGKKAQVTRDAFALYRSQNPEANS